jgi:Zn-dependent membrane protease YugP
MHPIAIILPAAALIVGPRLWVNHVLKQYNRKEEDLPGTAAQLARELLDRQGLQDVAVERTDLGDHYDPRTRVVRLSRDKFERKSLTALTTAAHEVSHAIQHATGYRPFVWRGRLAKLAQVTGEAGFAVLLAVPITALATRKPLPPTLVGSAAVAMLGTGMAAQLAAVPTELDASFSRALPMLQDAYVDDDQVADVKKILVACSLTYIASSLVAVLHIWPWLGRGTGAGLTACQAVSVVPVRKQRRRRKKHRIRVRKRNRDGLLEDALRQFGKPLIRSWLRYSRKR